MRSFTHIDATSIDEIIPLLNMTSRPIAGGTDLLPLMKEGLAAPERLLNLKRVDELRTVRSEADGLWIGALATLDDLDRHTDIRRDYPALAEAARLSASPQLRNMATIGGNLLQQSRCWYYRSDAPCWLKGGQECLARDGRNDQHAIFDLSPCITAYPSDPPVALVALDASIRIIGAQGERTIAVAELLQPPTEQRRTLHTLGDNELIVGVRLPKRRLRSIYLKAMDRAVWAYALASVAVAADVVDGHVYQVRIVLGGVANTPLRATQAEQIVEAQRLSEEIVRDAGQAALVGAQPLTHNHYKLTLVRNLVTQALRELLG